MSPIELTLKSLNTFTTTVTIKDNRVNLIDLINKSFYEHRAHVTISDCVENGQYKIQTTFGKNILILTTNKLATLHFFYQSLFKTFTSVDKQRKILVDIVRSVHKHSNSNSNSQTSLMSSFMSMFTSSSSSAHSTSTRVSINLKHQHKSFILLEPQSNECKQMITFIKTLTDEYPVKIEMRNIPSEHHAPKVIYINGHSVNAENFNMIDQYVVSLLDYSLNNNHWQHHDSNRTIFNTIV